YNTYLHSFPNTTLFRSYMTPAGRKIQAVGIRPDVVIDEVEGDFVDINKKESSFIREKDLKNHLTASVETSEERKNREEQELKERSEEHTSELQSLRHLV